MRELAGFPKELQDAFAEALKLYGDREDVTGVDIGYKYEFSEEKKKDVKTDILTVRIHVREKKNEADLEPSEIFLTKINEVPTDVIEATYVAARRIEEERDITQRRKAFNVIQPGISVGHYKGTAGTIGLIVHDRFSGKPAVLSNWHVLCLNGRADHGDEILQPGPSDRGKAGHHTIALLGQRENIDQAKDFVIGHDGDAAIAILNGKRKWTYEQYGTNARLKAIRDPKFDEILVKSGRKTGITHGRVDGFGRYYIDGYPGKPLAMDGFRIGSRDPENPDGEPVSAPGDSGSCWYASETGEAVGLHCAGEYTSDTQKEQAVACFLTRVFDRLAITLDKETELKPKNNLKSKIGGKKMAVNFAVEATNKMATNERTILLANKSIILNETKEHPDPGSTETQVTIKPRQDTDAGNFDWWIEIQGFDDYQFSKGAGVEIVDIGQKDGWTILHLVGWEPDWTLVVTKNESPYRPEQSTNVTIGDNQP